MDEMMDNFDALDPTALEAAVTEMDLEQIDEFNGNVDYEKFIVLNKKEITNFCRIVEPLTKASIDDYGKSVFVKCVSDDQVELKYWNNPYVVTSRVSNKSNKQVKSFAVPYTTLKKLTTCAFTSIILVENEGEMNIAFAESLLYLETKPLKEIQYDFDKKATDHDIDREVAAFTFKKIASILSQTDRASEKVAVVKNATVHFNTGFFSSKSKSPFEGDESLVLYKQCSDILAVLSEISKVSLKYSVHDNVLAVNSDDLIYCEMPIGVGNKVMDFLSPAAESILNFDANISIINDSLARLVAMVQSLDYLSDIVTLRFRKDVMEFVITTPDQKKTSVYKFNILEGVPDIEGEMKLTVGVLKIFFNIVGLDVKYNFNSSGLGIKNEYGNFLIRKS